MQKTRLNIAQAHNVRQGATAKEMYVIQQQGATCMRFYTEGRDRWIAEGWELLKRIK